jgi:methionine-gamma-lyase
MKKREEALETIIVHGDHQLDPQTGSLSPPLYPSSTFAFKSSEQGAALFKNPSDGYFYTRVSNPTIDLLRKKIALLEDSEEALAFGSGMAAIHAIVTALAGSGDNLLVANTVYGGTYKLLTEFINRFNIEVRWVDCHNFDEVESKIDSKTKFLFIETPDNPTTTIYDLSKLSEITSKKSIPLVVDNTFMTPYLQQPLKLGADIIVHSATKYICGHADVVAGLVACNKEYYEKIFPVLVETGGIIGPFEAWLLLRGIKTLHIRMERHSANALQIARYLEQHRLVKRILYPGLPSHPQYELARHQMKDSGGIISFELEGGTEACKILMDNVHVFTLAISLGDIDSLIQHPVTMTHSSYPKEMLDRDSITDGMIRLSVGLENVNDLIEDLEYALSRVEELVKI